jgi:hypothetical protein
MSSSDPPQQFVETCNRVGMAARNAGLSLEKAPKDHVLMVSKDGRSVSFPIVSDDRDWRALTPEEAFYAVILDADAFASARTDGSALDGLDVIERGELPIIETDKRLELQRLRDLAAMMGGPEAVKQLWLAAGFDGHGLASVFG